MKSAGDSLGAGASREKNGRGGSKFYVLDPFLSLAIYLVTSYSTHPFPSFSSS